MDYRGNERLGSPNELQHWKYIKRERKNGKWRYYYHDDDYTDARDKYGKASVDHERAKQTSRSYRQFVSYYQEQLDKKYGDKQLTDKDKNLQGWKDMRDKAADEARDTYQRLKYAEKEFERAKKIYNKSFGHKVADVLNKSSDAIDKGKKWLKKLLS